VGGDLGFTFCLTLRYGSLFSAQEKWLEVSSISNFETFQANRLILRFLKIKDGKTRTGTYIKRLVLLALPRILASILETYQNRKWNRYP